MADPDRRTPLLNSYENAAVIASGIAAEQVTLRTPCPGYDVAGLIDHLVEAAYRAAALGRGRTPPAGDNLPHVELADAPAQLRRAAEEAAQAWGDDSRLSSSFTMPWGEEYSGATLVNMYLAELAAHAWDLALATGQLGKLDPSLAAPALDGARAMIEPEYRDMVATGSPFGAEVPPPPDADDWERLAAFMGRNPRASLDQSQHRKMAPMSHVRRFDHVGITVVDLDAVMAFFVGLGFEVEGTRVFVEGEFLDTVIGIPDSRTEIVMLRPPDGSTRLELSSFVRPAPQPRSPTAMANELGLRNVAFEVDDLQASVDELAADGYGLVGDIGQYEHMWRVAYVRGPEGIIVSLAERIG